MKARTCAGCGKPRGCEAYQYDRYWHLGCLLAERKRLNSVVQKACDRCSQGVMDANNPHLTGSCQCTCHGSVMAMPPEVVTDVAAASVSDRRRSATWSLRMARAYIINARLKDAVGDFSRLDWQRVWDHIARREGIQ